MMKIPIALAIFLSFGVAFAQSSEHKDAVSSNTKQQRNNEIQGTENVPFVVKILPPSNTEQKATEDRESRKEKIERELNNLTAQLGKYTKVIVGVAILQLIVFGYQGWQLKRTVESGERIERPFIVESYFPFQMMPPGNAINVYPDSAVEYVPTVRYGIVNCGKTPAIIFDEYVGLILIEELPAIPPYQEWIELGDAVLPSNDSRTDAFVTLDNIAQSRNFSVEEWKQMRDGEKFFLFFGRVRYKSIFGKEHETRWAYRWYIKEHRSYFAAVGGETYNKRT